MIPSTFASKLIAVAVAGTLLMTGVGMYVAYVQAFTSVEQDLTKRVGTIARTIAPRELTALTGTSADIGTPAYLELKDKLASIRAVSPSVRFVYVMQLRDDGKVYFVADSEPTGSPDESPAGQHYAEVDAPTRAYLALVNRGYEPTPELTPPYKDRWGYWTSVLAPLHDERGRHFVVGADVDYAAQTQALYIELGAIALVSLFFLLLLCAAWYIVEREAAFAKTKVLFMSIASHELRTPLTGIRWASEVLLAPGSTLGPTERESVKRINEESVNLIALINDFLEYVSTVGVSSSTRAWQLIPMRDLVLHSVAIHRDALREAHVTLNTDAVDASVMYGVRGVRAELQSVVDNVLSNAIKYSRSGGVVTLSLTTDGKYVQLVVKDHGIGISTEDQKKVFAGMYRSAAAKAHTHVGTGLGLHLVKRMVEKFGGSVTLSSHVGQGTTVTVRLPLAQS